MNAAIIAELVADLPTRHLEGCARSRKRGRRSGGCQHDYRVRFVTAAELVTLLVEAQQQGRLARKLAQVARLDVVHCDELGYVPARQGPGRRAVGFISQRYERRSLVVTTNLPLVRWFRGLPRPDGGRRGHRPGRPPRDGAADRGRQLPVGGREAEPATGIRQEGRASMMPARAVGPISMTVRSPASRPGGSLHPRFAGLMAFDAGYAHGPGRSCPTARERFTQEGRKI